MSEAGNMLKVAGASLYYEMRGTGPTLLIIPGGPQDAGVFTELAGRLADRYTVVTYDPRGNSRSIVDAGAEPLDVDQQADDAAALIRAVGPGPANVFGTSGGAQIGFSLAARYPELVSVLVAHEPPAMMLMEGPDAAVAAVNGLHHIYRSEGVGAAMAAFFGDNGLGSDGPPPFEMSADEQATFERVSGNFEYWLAHGMLPLSFYRPDVEALRTGRTRVVVAIGKESAGHPIEAMAQAAATRLGLVPVRFPGDHMGFGPQAGPFAEALGQALQG